MSVDDGEFTDFVRVHSRALLRTAYYLTGDRGLAEDLLQASLTKTYLHWHRIRSRGAEVAYVRKTMVNTSINWWRRMSWQAERPRDDLPAMVVEDGTDAIDERAGLIEAVRRLPARQRAVVALRYLEDLSEAETARLLGCSPGTVKSNTSRALKRLRSELNESALELVEER